MAKEFEKLAEEVSASTTDYIAVATRAMHVLSLGFANLHMGRVVEEAAAADVAKAKGE